LEQARYGEIHKGRAVTIFVTEPFSKSKQVKLDDYKAAGDDRANVMKLNMTKNFNTVSQIFIFRPPKIRQGKVEVY